MDINWRMALVSLISVACLTGCAHRDPWAATQSPGLERYFYIPPDPPMPQEQAIGTLKNLQTSFSTWQGYGISVLDVDRFGLRVKGTKDEAYAEPFFYPAWGGFFSRGSRDPFFYGGYYHSWGNTVRLEEVVVIPFDRVSEIRLLSVDDPDSKEKWGVAFRLEGAEGETAFRFRDQETARGFATAVASLAAAQGRDLSRKGSVGLHVEDLTPAQRKDLTAQGHPSGARVAGVLKAGPAEKAGLLQGDVITAIDGSPATSAAEAGRLLAAGGPEVTLTILRRGARTTAKQEKDPRLGAWAPHAFTVGKWR